MIRIYGSWQPSSLIIQCRVTAWRLIRKYLSFVRSECRPAASITGSAQHTFFQEYNGFRPSEEASVLKGCHNPRAWSISVTNYNDLGARNIITARLGPGRTHTVQSPANSDDADRKFRRDLNLMALLRRRRGGHGGTTRIVR